MIVNCGLFTELTSTVDVIIEMAINLNTLSVKARIIVLNAKTIDVSN